METTITDPLASAQEAAASAAQIEGAPALGRDDFMRLLVAKLENQDPLQPAKDTEFISQLATFSSLEQLVSVNDNLEFLAGRQEELISSQALNLIGKEALVESGNELRIKDGRPDTLVYSVPEQARDATLTLIDSVGETVKTFELDTSPKGPVTLEWDGLDDEGNPLEDGDYTVRVNATDAEGEAMEIALFRSLLIDGVNFLNGSITLVSADREIPFEAILEIRQGHS